MHGFSHFSFYSPITLAKSCLFPIVITFAKTSLHYEAPSLRQLSLHDGFASLYHKSLKTNIVFRFQAFSTKPDCDSDWSVPLIVICPGVETPLVKRIQSQQINCIRVGWERPVLKGGAQVENYKVLTFTSCSSRLSFEDRFPVCFILVRFVVFFVFRYCDWLISSFNPSFYYLTGTFLLN